MGLNLQPGNQELRALWTGPARHPCKELSKQRSPMVLLLHYLHQPSNFPDNKTQAQKDHVVAVRIRTQVF